MAYFPMVMAAFESEPRIETTSALCEEALATSTTAQTVGRSALFRVIRHGARRIAGAMPVAGQRDDADLGVSDIAALSQSPHSRYLVSGYDAITAVIFCEWDAALAACRAVEPPASSQPPRLFKWSHAMALAHALRVAPAEEREPLRRALAPLVQSLARSAQRSRRPTPWRCC